MVSGKRLSGRNGPPLLLLLLLSLLVGGPAWAQTKTDLQSLSINQADEQKDSCTIQAPRGAKRDDLDPQGPAWLSQPSIATLVSAVPAFKPGLSDSRRAEGDGTVLYNARAPPAPVSL